MTDKEDKDVVVNLFKNANPKIMSKDAAAQTPKEEYQKMVIDSLETIKKDINTLKATGMITVLMDDEGPVIDYFIGSLNLTQAYVLMDQLKGVIMDKLSGENV